MTDVVGYRSENGIATVRMDDGKRNALSPTMFAQLNAAFDRAEAERATVILTGRAGVFSAGFDLRVLMAGGSAASGMVIAGFELAERILSFPTPVVVASSGHAIAMGAFLLIAGDYRLGAAGPFRIGANEVAIGITMPYFAVEICRQRLAPTHFNRSVVNAEMYAPADAVSAGFLDRVVPADDLLAAAGEVATTLAGLDAKAHAASKLRARAESLRAIRGAIEADAAGFASALAVAS